MPKEWTTSVGHGKNPSAKRVPIYLNMMGEQKDCSDGCAACCIALDIKNDDGTMFKRKGVRCKFLNGTICTIYDSPKRPLACSDYSCLYEEHSGNVRLLRRYAPRK